MRKIDFKNLKKTFIIAEIGNNHEGNIKLAKKLIALASKAKVDAVKFQTFHTEEFINKNDKKRFSQLKKFELTKKQFIDLKNFAHLKKLRFISSPLDIDSANFLIKNSDVIKIASSDNNFFPMMDRLISSKKNIIISTGLTNIDEIIYLRNRIYKLINKKTAHQNIAFLHCVTSYPVNDKYANLNSINFLKDKLDFTIGYSDHTLGNDAALVSSSMGAKILEKHFTIDKNFSNFRDHSLSADFKELSDMVKKIRKIELLKGNYEKKIQNCEKIFLNSIRRAAFAKQNLNSGQKLTLKNIKFLRASNSRNFFNIDRIVGKKIIKPVKKDNKITKKNLI